MNITLSEIKNILSRRDAKVERVRHLLNGNPAYRVTYKDGSYKIRTLNDLKLGFENGDI